MNIANQLTIFRVLLIPVFLVVLLGSFLDPAISKYVATAIFVVASLTDFLDGYLARSRNLVTNFGKFMDPLADKLLVCAALVGLVELHRLPAWAVIVIISREFIITGMRTVAASENIVVAASIWGKIKTSTQMVMIILFLLQFEGMIFFWLEKIFFILAVFFTILSGVDYMVKNRSVFHE